MTLRNKTLFIIAVTLIGLTVAFFWISRMVLHTSFSQVEIRDARLNTIRAVNALQREVLVLDTKVHDWAAWDDTYRFIVDRNSEYIESNIVRDTFNTLNIHFMIYLDSAGTVVFSKGFETGSDLEVSIPDDLVHLLSQGGNLVRHHRPNESVSGILTLPEGCILVASRPIVTSADQGPVRGTLIFARYFDDSEISRLSEITRIAISIRNWNDPSLPGDFLEAAANLTRQNPIVIRFLSSNTIAGYKQINDIFGNPCLILNTTMPREILAQEKHSVWILIIVLFITGSVFTVSILLFLEKSVFSRLTRLSREFGDIGIRGDFSGRIGNDEKDELDEVASSGNRMLEALEEAHTRISGQNREMRTIMDTVPIALLTLDSEYRVSGEYSKSAEIIFSMSGLEGKSYFDLLGLEEGGNRDVLREYLTLLQESDLHEEDMAGLNPLQEIQLPGKDDGEFRWVKIEYNLILHDGDVNRNILAVIEDITRKRELSEQVTKSEAEIAQILAVAESPDIYREFLSLTDGIMNGIKERRAGLDKGPADPETINEIFRDVHTLKGTANAFGAFGLSRMAGEMEDILAIIRRTGHVSPEYGKDMDRLTRGMEGEFGKVAGTAEKILGDGWRENSHVYLRIPLNEVDALCGIAREIREYENVPDERISMFIGRLRALRLIPAKKGLARSMRIIEDLLHSTGKNISFHFEDNGVNIDCMAARALNDPLVHLFRNAISHGIEDPLERISFGKPETGQVRLVVKKPGKETVIEFSDDGRGLDHHTLRETAVRKGILSPETASALSPQECLEIIFRPGFTTVGDVNALSGRGVGMDAVLSGISRFNGAISIDPSTTVGTRFIIRIPPLGE